MRRQALAGALVISVMPSLLASQTRVSKPAEAAFAQIRAGRLDSAEVLLRPVLDSAAKPSPADRGMALMLLGVIHFYRGRDSATEQDFRAALQATLALQGEWLSQLDSSLGAVWHRQRWLAICSSPGLDFTGTVAHEDSVEQKPEVVSGPYLRYPAGPRRAGVQGRVLLAAVVDTTGRAEPGSIKVLSSPGRGFTREAERYLVGAVFKPARVGQGAVRVCINLPIDFKIRR